MADKSAAETVTFQVAAERAPEHALYLQRALAEGTYGDSQFSVTQTIPGSSLIIELDGERWLVALDAIIHPLLDALHARKACGDDASG
jgi:hypothetical protein